MTWLREIESGVTLFTVDVDVARMARVIRELAGVVGAVLRCDNEGWSSANNAALTEAINVLSPDAKELSSENNTAHPWIRSNRR